VGDDRERTEKTVTALYNRLLLRSPDVAGLESYANQLETGEIDFETLIDRFPRIEGVPHQPRRF